MIPNDLEQHCCMLFELLPLPSDAVRHIFMKSADGVIGTWVRRPQNLARILRAYAYDGRWNLYWQLNPTRRRDVNRPCNGDVDYLQAVLIDIDPVEEKVDPHKAVDHAVILLSSQFGVQEKSMTIMDSGRGCQIWLHTSTPNGGPIDLAIQQQELQLRVAPFVRRVAAEFGTQHGCRVDTACQDMTRLARLPGTYNQKTSEGTFVVQEGEGAPPYWLVDIPADEEYTVRDVLGEGPVEATRTKWPDIVAHLTWTAYSFITDGVCEPGRHKAAVATVRNLHREIGVPIDVAQKLLLTGASRCTPSLIQKAADLADIMRILQEEYHRAED